MNHADHVRLLKDGVPQPGGVWADFGAGAGAFTLALAELIGPQAEIFAIDRDAGALRRMERAMQERFGASRPQLHCLSTDYTRPVELPPLDGVVMANALHFQRQKRPVLQAIQDYLKPGGRLLLVEYNTDRGNTWVPYPLSYPTWEALAETAGFEQVLLLARQPSRFLGEIYSAVCRKPGRTTARGSVRI